MDTALLTFFNKTLANPVLDFIMIGFTTGANLILPGIGIILLIKKQRRVGWAILTALIISLVLVVCLQLFADRPRPETLRFVWPKPELPSYPSSHAATAFAVAAVLLFSFRQFLWQIIFFVVAVLIGFSRLYLGLHYFSDFFGGAVLGAAIGITCYGLIVDPSTGSRKWRWFLWPQLALVIILTQMSYLDLPPGHKFGFRLADEIVHFLAFGAVVFWLNIWLNGRKTRLFQKDIPIAFWAPFTFAIIEEGFQFFSSYRTVSITDLLSDLAGMIFFWWLSNNMNMLANKSLKGGIG
jgi:undecaprenyl-diphosphatase